MPNQYQQKDNTGAMFLISPKESEKHPDFNGTVMIGGREYWISGWKKVGKKTGKKFLSIAVKPKEARVAAPQSSGDGW